MNIRKPENVVKDDSTTVDKAMILFWERLFLTKKHKLDRVQQALEKAKESIREFDCTIFEDDLHLEDHCLRCKSLALIEDIERGEI